MPGSGPLKFVITAASDKAIGKAGAGGEHLDTDLPGTWLGDIRFVSYFQNLGTAKPDNANVLPCHMANMEML